LVSVYNQLSTVNTKIERKKYFSAVARRPRQRVRLGQVANTGL
jgi:hypothetical protein